MIANSFMIDTATVAAQQIIAEQVVSPVMVLVPRLLQALLSLLMVLVGVLRATLVKVVSLEAAARPPAGVDPILLIVELVATLNSEPVEPLLLHLQQKSPLSRPVLDHLQVFNLLLPKSPPRAFDLQLLSLPLHPPLVPRPP